MIYRLRSYDQTPPRCYVFQQTGVKARFFTAQPLIEAQAKIVFAYRKGNHLPGSTYRECLLDIDRYCANNVLHGDSRYTVAVESDSAGTIPLQANAPGLSPCAGCGVVLE